MGNKITSEDITLKYVVENKMLFNIPIYQRLYVWGNEQIKTLLEDLHNAHQNKLSNYYLGGIMITKNNDKYDLIDGQQRFTTLWLISHVLKGSLSDFSRVPIDKIPKSRLSFSVRDFANNYFDSDAILQDHITDDEIAELTPIVNGLETIKNFISTEVEDKEAFANFIFNKLLLVATKMPNNTDENKVFEAMNNRGVQLQQHEILKSELLSVFKNDRNKMHQYALIWDACSMMDDYLEKNIKQVANLKWKDLFEDVNSDEERLVELPDDILQRLAIDNSSTEKKDLLSIIQEQHDNSINNNDIEVEEEYESGIVRSIISFPMLLLHTLRIYQFEYKKVDLSEYSAEVKGKELIRIFRNLDSYFENEADVADFINLLWEVRRNFDKYVIKWVSNEQKNEELHIIKKLYRSKTAFQRKSPTENSRFALLQSMLYHSQQIITHYWLTPFLYKMLKCKNENSLLEWLEKLDNAMFCNEKRDLRTMSFDMLGKEAEGLKGDPNYVEEVLTSHLGTQYPSYWFYKTEYLLWINRKDFSKSQLWENYKMTAKNSVEHISPQNPKAEDNNILYDVDDTEELKKHKLNDFGNLVLLSPGMNSEYSNKAYVVKRTEFSIKKRLDSLKSDIIFQNEIWNWDLCEDHRKNIVNLFRKHLN